MFDLHSFVGRGMPREFPKDDGFAKANPYKYTQVGKTI